MLMMESAKHLETNFATIEAGKKFGDFLDKDLQDGIKKLTPEEEEIYLPKIQLAWKPNNLIGALWKSCLSR